MYLNLIQKQFFRLRPSDIHFSHISTTINNKKRRRGNYLFLLTLKEEGEDGEIISYPTEVYFLPQQSDYMFDNAFDHHTEELMATGDSRKAYLKTCEPNPSRKTNVLVLDETVLKPSVVRQIKTTICEIFHRPEKMISESKRGTFHSPYAQNKIGNFDIVVRKPED